MAQFIQFTSDGVPYWDNGGVGIMQLTPPPSDDDSWSWKENIDDGITTFNQKLSKSVTFAQAILNDVRERLGQQGLAATVDPWTPRMVILNAIRGYNGYSHRHSKWTFGLPLLELMPDEDRPDHLVATGGEINWIHTPIKLRDGIYDARYVDHVLKWFKPLFGVDE